MAQLSCIIIDDEPLAQALLENYVNKTPFLELKGTFSNAIEAMAMLRTEPVNLVFLDIQMPELSGLELAKLIPSTTKIIFTTAFSQYAIEGYKVHAIGYLLKPIAYPDFLEAAGRALKNFEQTTTTPTSSPQTAEQQSLFIKSDYKLVRVDYDDILYIEGLKDYVKIYTASSQRAILSLTSMKSIEDHLPPSVFMRVHRSYIVNMERISAVEKNSIIIDEKSIPVSDTYRDRVHDYVAQRTLITR